MNHNIQVRKGFQMKSKLMGAKALICLILSLITSANALPWEDITPTVYEYHFYEVYNFGGYQFALQNNGGICRRAYNSSVWTELMESIESFPENPFDYENRFTRWNNMIHSGDYLFLINSSCSYYSTDTGTTWIPCTQTLKVSDKIQVSSSGVWYDKNGSKIVRSTDMGMQWSEEANIPGSVSSISLYKEKLWIGSWGKIYHRDTDGTGLWDTLSTGLPERCAVQHLLQVNDTLVLADTDLGLYSSTNAGNTWQLYSDQFSRLNNEMIREMTALENTVLIRTARNIYRFSDPVTAPVKLDLSFLKNASLRDIDIVNQKFSLTCLKGMFLSEDRGETWISTSEGLPEKARAYFVYIRNNDLYVSFYSSDGKNLIYRKSDEGKSWQWIINTHSDLRHFFVQDSTIIFRTYRSIHRSDDYGETFISSLFDRPTSREHPDNGYMFWINDTLYSTPFGSVQYSTDLGYSWTKIAEGYIIPATHLIKLDKKIILSRSLYGPDVPLNNSLGLLVVEEKADTFILHEEPWINKLKPRGVYWFHDTLWSSGRRLTAPGDTTFYTIFSSDTGTTWDTVQTVSRDIYRGSIRESGSLMFGKGRNGNLLFSKDKGYTWEPAELPTGFEKNFHRFYLTDSTIIINDNKTMYRLPLAHFTGETSVVKPSSIRKKSLSVRSTTGQIHLKLDLPAQSGYSLNLYTLTGRLVKRLTGHAEAGRITRNFNISDLSRGCYIYKLEAGKQTLVRQILIQ